MRTRNETYSSQTTRERTSVSSKTNWLKSSEMAIAGMNAENSSLTGAWKIRKTSVQNHTDQMIKSIFNVTILTSRTGEKSAQKTSKKMK